MKCPYCGEEVSASEFAEHHAKCEARKGKPKTEAEEEEGLEIWVAEWLTSEGVWHPDGYFKTERGARRRAEKIKEKYGFEVRVRKISSPIEIHPQSNPSPEWRVVATKTGLDRRVLRRFKTRKEALEWAKEARPWYEDIRLVVEREKVYEEPTILETRPLDEWLEGSSSPTEGSSSESSNPQIFDKIVSAAEECSKNVLKRLNEIIAEAGVKTDYGRGALLDMLSYTFSRLPREFLNEDWDTHQKRGVLKREYNEMLKRLEEWVMYDVDRMWGFEEPLLEELPKPGEEAKRLALKLLAPFLREREEFFKEIGDETRYRERYASQRAVKSALINFDLCMKAKVKELS